MGRVLYGGGWGLARTWVWVGVGRFGGGIQVWKSEFGCVLAFDDRSRVPDKKGWVDGGVGCGG